jgi:hypothetical protein
MGRRGACIPKAKVRRQITPGSGRSRGSLCGLCQGPWSQAVALTGTGHVGDMQRAAHGPQGASATLYQRSTPPGSPDSTVQSHSELHTLKARATDRCGQSAASSPCLLEPVQQVRRGAAQSVKAYRCVVADAPVQALLRWRDPCEAAMVLRSRLMLGAAGG